MEVEFLGHGERELFTPFLDQRLAQPQQEGAFRDVGRQLLFASDVTHGTVRGYIDPEDLSKKFYGDIVVGGYIQHDTVEPSIVLFTATRADTDNRIRVVKTQEVARAYNQGFLEKQARIIAEMSVMADQSISDETAPMSAVIPHIHKAADELAGISASGMRSILTPSFGYDLSDRVVGPEELRIFSLLEAAA